MTRISKQKLKKEALLRIENRLVEAVVKTQSTSSGKRFVDELLSPSEKIMLAKRLGVAFMLLEGVSPYYIAKVLGMSTSTTLRIKKQLEKRELPYLVSFFEKTIHRYRFWVDIEMLIRAGMPPIAGRGRWKWFYELQSKYDTRNRK